MDVITEKNAVQFYVVTFICSVIFKTCVECSSMGVIFYLYLIFFREFARTATILAQFDSLFIHHSKPT